MIASTCLIAATVLGCLMLAAWPVAFSRVLRTAVSGAGGMLCIAAGAIGFFVLASGLAGNAGAAGRAVAAEPGAGKSKSSGGESAFLTKADATALHSPVAEMPDEVKIIGDPPAWVGSKPNREGSVHTAAVCSGPYSSGLEAEAALDKELEKETAAYIEWALGSKLAPQFIHCDADQIKRELLSSGKTYSDVVESPTVGVMQRRHALIEFGPNFRERIQHEWNHVKATWRLAQLGLVGAGAILLLGTIFSYFRLDNATRGYYTGRLQFLSAAAILAIVGAGAILARWIHWL